MSLMYSIIGMARGLGVEKIIIFNPKKKFTKLRIPFDTKNKTHKKLSVDSNSVADSRAVIAKVLIDWKYPELLNEFVEYKKQDDISDALLQLFVESSTEEERMERPQGPERKRIT